VPIFWSEDAKVLTENAFFQFHDHYYTRPRKYLCGGEKCPKVNLLSSIANNTERASSISMAGAVVGLVTMMVGASILVYERFQKKKFMTRVYIDG
jgi:hypothetical protein